MILTHCTSYNKMLKIRALNRESSSDEDVPIIRREAQEEIALEQYNKALRLQIEGKFAESEKILSLIIEENIPLLENNGGLPKSMSTLKYSCNVNIGNVLLKQDRVNEALQKYLEASELDGTDVTLWHKIGKLSLKEDKFHQAAYAFSKGLECSESHWPCLDQLISILYATRDTIACLEYIGKALILDSEYLKGLVLRRQIYRDNPAAKDYYQLYNPDYIWEPSLDIDIHEDDEKLCLVEAQILCDRVTEIEKSLGPKPLQTIPLPKPLAEQSWMSLAETVIYLHQYISDNEMSHFTMIDMTKCMSQSSETKLKKESPFKFNDNIEQDGVAKNTEQVNVCGSEMNMDVEPVIERRYSVTSETNTDKENTPVQTDNDEEQNMDIDTEEADDNAETKVEKVRVRGSKRKRDLLSDLKIWGWHSKRKPPKKVKDHDHTIEDALNRIIPSMLLKNKIDIDKCFAAEDSMNTMDIYNLYMDDNKVNYLSPIHSPRSVNYEPYFNTDREKDNVLEFWTRKREHCDAVVLIRELVHKLSKLWHYKWPKELVPLYLTAYNMFREHCDPPQLFCSDWTFDAMRDDALATLLYGELLSFSSDSTESIHPTMLGYLQVISCWEEEWKDEYPSVFSRVFWLRSYLFRKQNHNDLAIRALELIQEVIEEQEERTHEKYMLSLPNCFKYGLITSQITGNILKHLELMNSLATVENLFNAEKYSEVADIIKKTFGNTNHPQIGRMGRPAQLGMLMHSLWFTNMEECFVWTEECVNEALDHFLKPRKDAELWEKLIEKCLAFLSEIIKKESVMIVDALQDEKKSRLVENLAKIVSKQLNSENLMKMPLGCVTPWILLHYILMRDEQRQYAIKRAQLGKHEKSMSDDYNQDNEIYPSLAILFSAHEFLGRKGWCLTNQGELLHFIIDTVLDRLDTPIFEGFKDKIEIHVEQAFFCLYQHPSKKNKISRHLADHNVDPLPLLWERALQLYEFFGPDQLPEFNSYKNASISADLEQLLKRIIALVPTANAPHPHLPKIVDYIYGRSDKMPEAIEFPRKIAAIYFLIGDFFFKQKEFTKCIKYFQFDLCINPTRLDSWACLGLSYAAQLDAKLNHCVKFKNENEFLDKAKCATICFKQSLDISPDHLILWIEFGTFQYTVHSFCSRVLKYESENLSMEKFEQLEDLKNHYLDSSGNSFEKAITLYEMEDTNEPDERWLQYYILGKIAEKKRKEPSEYLQYYMTASTLLNENNAEYPDKINYANPQHLAVEALELRYRIHASVLKYLELHEGKDIPNTLGHFFSKCLNSCNWAKKSPPTPPNQSQQAVSVQPTTSDQSTTAVEPTDVPPKPTENGINASFQDQFLNSISKSNDKDSDTLTGTAKEVLKEHDEKEVNTVSENDVEMKDVMSEISDKKINDESKNSKSEETLPEDKVLSAETVVDQNDGIIVDAEINSKEDTAKSATAADVTDDVIMIIDSDEEKDSDSKKSPKTDDKDGKTEPPPEEPKKDVQKLLDEMMEETMKETEQQHNEADSDLSGTERIEEVVVKDDDAKPQLVESNLIDKKISEIETENDNKKHSNESSSSGISSSSSGSSSESDSDDDSSSSSSSSSSEENENMSNSEISQLVDKCVSGLETCIVRLGQNYKALYRLAHLFFHNKSKKDITKSRQLLLGEYKCKDGSMVGGLFNDRKPTNFFNGIWRIPSTEIDRPGSLSAHMSRCISLVLQLLRVSNDNKTLIDLAMQLRKMPEPDKVYIKDADRATFSDQALTMCSQCFRSQMKNLDNMTNIQKSKLLQEIFRVYQRVMKHIPGKETVFANMLAEVYKKFIKEKIPDHVNVLELAVKFCLQSKQGEKQKLSAVNNAVPLPRAPGITVPPVLPSPATITAAQPVLPKKMGAGRPRGRPPKPPGQVRQPRAPKNPSTSNMNKAYNWQKSLYDQTYAYEYLKHYQDELIKQYSQTLNINQLAQLTQMLNQGQLNNPVSAAGLAGQFMNQSGLLTPSSLVKQMTAGSGLSGPSSTQFMDSLKHLSPGLKKKLVADQSLSSLTAEQKKFLDTMLPPAAPKPPPTKSSSQATVPVSSSASVPSKSKLPSQSKQPSTTSGKPGNGESAKVKQVNVPHSSTSSTSLFKEIPNSATFETPKVPKDIVKDRPNLSITPVNLPPPTTGPSFIRPVTTTAPGGKTLQEKLAEKKKEQLNKQLKSSIESEIRADALLKGMTIPNIPSSLTLSKTSVPISNPTFPGNPVQLPIVSKPITSNPNISKPIPSNPSISKSVPSNPMITKSIPSNPVMSKPGNPSISKSIYSTASISKSIPSNSSISKSISTNPKPITSNTSLSKSIPANPKPIPGISKPVPNMLPPVPSSFPGFPMNFAHPLGTSSHSFPPKKQMKMASMMPSVGFPTSAMHVPQPQFPIDPAIPISQVSPKKSKEKIKTHSSPDKTVDLLKKLSSRESLDISPVESIPPTTSKSKNQPNHPVAKAVKKSITPSQISGLEIIPSGSSGGEKKMVHPKHKPGRLKQVIPKAEAEIFKIIEKTSSDESKRLPSKSAIEISKGREKQEKQRDSSDDDVICID